MSGHEQKMVFITGATGYLGHVVVNSFLKSNWQVTAMSRHPPSDALRSGLIWQENDVSTPFSIPAGVGTVVHCAGVIEKDNQVIRKVNVEGTHNLIQAAAEKGCLLVHVSSAGVAGPHRNTVIDEMTPCNPANVYEETKFEAEQLIQAAIRNGLRAQILRPTTIFGYGRNPSQDSILHLMRAIKSGAYRNIGKGQHNLVHVQEVAQAILALTDPSLKNGGVFYINTSVTFGHFAQLVRAETLREALAPPSLPYPVAFAAAVLMTAWGRVVGRKMPLTLSRLAALTNTTTYSARRLELETGYRPLRTLDEWIKQVCRDYQENGLL